MTLAYKNLRLGELAAVADLNKHFYDDFVSYLKNNGYSSVFDFIKEKNNERSEAVILQYFIRELPEEVFLHDGIARPYKTNRAKWLFMGWLLRDAPAQRLQPMVSSMEADSVTARKAKLLSVVKETLIDHFPTEDYWTWYTFREVMIDRLEGSRRALKGTLFEAIVRRNLERVFKENKLPIEISKVELSLDGETYDVAVSGAGGRVLIPVKTRETMGGGHALLFTRDIHKSISVASNAGVVCLPIVIAESWSGNLSTLECDEFVYIDLNPNQIGQVEPKLYDMLSGLSGFFKEKCLK
ncbi:hypothetical protein N9W89_12255 [Hellea sp.]|nr:hypothetical protein [Hellea sp.]